MLKIGTASTPHLTVVNSSDNKASAHWTAYQLYATQHHDTEPRSVYAYNSVNSGDPVVDFNKFFNGESLDQEDLVM
jgi:primary-amine oxidase